MSKSIFRNCGSGVPFTTLPNSLLQDGRLTWEERGMLCDLLSRPENFEVSVSGLAMLGDRGREKIYALLKNPLKLGYIVKIEEGASKAGRFSSILYEVYSLDAETRKQLSVSEYRTREDDTVSENRTRTVYEIPLTENRTQQKNKDNKRIMEKESAQLVARAPAPNLDEGLFPAKPDGGRGEPQFDRDFWKSYPKKKDRKRAHIVWSTKSTTERWKACDYRPRYLESDGVKGQPIKFIKSGYAYLRDEPWNDGDEDQPKPKAPAPDGRRLTQGERATEVFMERLRREHAAKKAAAEGRAAA